VAWEMSSSIRLKSPVFLEVTLTLPTPSPAPRRWFTKVGALCLSLVLLVGLVFYANNRNDTVNPHPTKEASSSAHNATGTNVSSSARPWEDSSIGTGKFAKDAYPPLNEYGIVFGGSKSSGAMGTRGLRRKRFGAVDSASATPITGTTPPSDRLDNQNSNTYQLSIPIRGNVPVDS
jgi:hypothetical protein